MNADKAMRVERDQITGLRSIFQTLARIRYIRLAGFPNDYAYLPVSCQNVKALNAFCHIVPDLNGFAFLE